jgi:hypothetical protein
MRGEGAVSGVVVTDEGASNAALLPALGRALFERGIASTLGKVYVSLAHSDADLEETSRCSGYPTHPLSN